LPFKKQEENYMKRKGKIKYLALYLAILVVLLAVAWQAQAQPVLNPANGHSYLGVETDPKITWFEAEAAAVAMTFGGNSGHLATITSQAENDIIVNLIEDDGTIPEYWLGGVQLPDGAEPDQGWQWVTGEPFLYTNWAGPEPNNSDGDEDHLHMTPGGEWNDIVGTRTDLVTGYVVEFPPLTVAIDITTCPQCGGPLTILAAIEDPAVIGKILSYLGLPTRAPPKAPARLDAFLQTA
jgi:hypothetical protein